mmetsp:Transcript_30223/g.68148  ORF Transcript_30223/g.68148 Transcript_30223/m.68148 type:complete len:229 (+) Transcript_30223:125-811(+)
MNWDPAVRFSTRCGSNYLVRQQLQKNNLAMGESVSEEDYSSEDDFFGDQRRPSGVESSGGSTHNFKAAGQAYLDGFDESKGERLQEGFSQGLCESFKISSFMGKALGSTCAWEVLVQKMSDGAGGTLSAPSDDNSPNDDGGQVKIFGPTTPTTSSTAKSTSYHRKEDSTQPPSSKSNVDNLSRAIQQFLLDEVVGASKETAEGYSGALQKLNTDVKLSTKSLPDGHRS